MVAKGEKVKAMQNKIKKNIQGTDSEGKETRRLKSTIRSRRKK